MVGTSWDAVTTERFDAFARNHPFYGARRPTSCPARPLNWRGPISDAALGFPRLRCSSGWARGLARIHQAQDGAIRSIAFCRSGPGRTPSSPELGGSALEARRRFLGAGTGQLAC